MVFRASVLTIFLAAAALAADGPAARRTFELHDGDRVAFIGNTLIEREQYHGYIELALTTRWPDRRVTFRNLGWSGDNVFGESRAFFGPPEDGFKHLIEHVGVVEPTVILVNYGANAAWKGETGLQEFVDGYNRLLDELDKTGARIVVLSPIPQERPDPLLPDPMQRNRDLSMYTDAINSLAAKRGYHFVDLFNPLRGHAGPPLTDNGVHPNERGYQRIADEIQRQLGIAGPAVSISSKMREQLRAAIVKKNELFFHRHRPQNETYLRGFRKHEQGNNAVEIEQFEPLAHEADQRIAELLQDAVGGAR